MPRNNFISSGGLNKDADKYYFPKGDYLDAKNIVVETGKEGGAGSTKTMNSVSTINVDLSSGLTNPVVKASIRDNDDNIYVLVKGTTKAKIYKISGSTATLLLTYTHAVTTDFDPDINIIGDVLVWNYREGGVPLSWYTERSAATITDITDLTLIKKPPAFVLPVSIESTGDAPSDLSISSSTFSEGDAAATTIGTITVTDSTSSDTADFTIMNAVDASNNDASSRFTLVDSDNTDATCLLKTVGTFNFNNTDDRSFILNIKVVDGDGLSYTESFNITVTNVNPTVTGATVSINENVSVGTNVHSVVAVNGSADGTNTGLTYAITGGNTNNDFAINSSTGQITVANSPDFETTTSYNLTVTATDVGGGVGTGTITVNIGNINEPPVSSNVNLSITSGNAVSGTLNATDPEGDAVLYEIVTNPSNGSLSLDNANTGAFTYTSAGGVNLAQFTYKAKDPSGSNTFGNTANVNISIPSLTVTITETDDDLSGVTVNTGGTVRVGKTGTVSGTATATGNFTGNTASEISISSSENSADLQNLTVSSNPTTANDTTITFNWSFDLVGAAQVGDSLTFAISVTLTNQP
tara:strand:- start:408 stop:2153 length:1746 start_codon:yes stop_codon:yes gene_type:complete